MADALNVMNSLSMDEFAQLNQDVKIKIEDLFKMQDTFKVESNGMTFNFETSTL